MKLREKLARPKGMSWFPRPIPRSSPHLIEKYYKGDFEEAVAMALRDIEGAYTMIAMMAGEKKLVAARKESPLIIGIGDRENFIASVPI